MRRAIDFMKSNYTASNTGRRTSGLLARYVLSALAGVICLCATVATAQSTNANSPPSFDSFNIISTRNIFDPNRRGIRRFERPSSRATDAFALVGTMSYSKGKFAFFDGTKPDYKKVLEKGATIAGYTVTDITPKNITLAANGTNFAMVVGTQMRNEGRNNWKMSDGTELPSTTDESPQPTADLTPPSGTSPAMSDVIKKLMEQRQQELK
jgi:hypothetical protein